MCSLACSVEILIKLHWVFVRVLLQDRCQQMSHELELSQQKYASELQSLSEQNKVLQTGQDEMYKRLRDENIETLRKQNQLYEELDKLRRREQEATTMCKEYQEALEKEREKDLSADRDNRKLQGELMEKVNEIRHLQLELDRVKYQHLKEQRQAVAEMNSLQAQLSYASEKLRSLERSSPPPSRQSSKSFRYEPPVRKMADMSTNSYMYVQDSTHSDVELDSQLQSEFNSLTTTGSQSVIPNDYSQTVEDDVLMFNSTSSEKRATLTIHVPPSRSGCVGASSRLSTFEESGHKESESRISELQRRNAKALPHLKSSYPIELQTQRESPSICDDRIKNGSSKNNHQDTVLSQPATKKPVAFEVSLDPEPDPVLWSTMISGQRKRTRDSDSADVSNGANLLGATCMRSPAPKSLRRTSAPPTPQTPNDTLSSSNNKTFTKDFRRLTMMPAGYRLREYLYKDSSQSDSSVSSAGQGNQATAFVVSPPKAKGKVRLPKRLQENLSQKSVVEKRQSQSGNARRETIVKRKPNVTTARRNALRNKN